MKVVGIVGSNAEVSYNRKLLQAIEKNFNNLFNFEVLEIKDVPMFSVSNNQTNHPAVQHIANKVMDADAVIISTPEHNHTVPPALKSLIEYLTYKIHPLNEKPVMIIGASYFSQGTSRAQLHLRSILEAPGSGAYVFPGNEFLLGRAKTAFDSKGNLADQGTHNFLESTLRKFIKFAETINGVGGGGYLPQAIDADTGASARESNAPDATSGASESSTSEDTLGGYEMMEDLHAKDSIDTTIEDVDMNSDNWVEEASEKVKAAKGDDYVKLNHGVLTVNQLNYMLKTVPYEVTYADDNNQFIYYSHRLERKDMLGGRDPEQVGSPLADVHPERAYKNVDRVVQALRNGNTDEVRIRIPGKPEQFKIHNYRAMHDEDGRYRGVHEMIFDLQPWVDWYFEQTGGEVVSQEAASATDATSGASQTTSSVTNVEEKNDAYTSATSQEAQDAEDLTASGKVKTTIEGVDMASDNWVEEAAEKVGAAQGNDYVELDRGILTVNQINYMLAQLPYEATFADDNNQFIYYNFTKAKEDMLGGRQPWQVGSPLHDVHPERARAGASWVVHQLRTGKKEYVRVRIPGKPGQFKVHNYQRMTDENGNYAGIHEMIFDLQPWIDWYLINNEGQHKPIDATKGSSSNDATSGASGATETQNASVQNDATSGASSTSGDMDGVTSASSAQAQASEELGARHVVDTSVIGVDKKVDDWVEQAAEKTDAAKGSDYVNLNRGIMTVDQIDWFLSALPYEATFADDNNQFLYYNYTKPKHEMLGGRQPWQVGSSLEDVHPERARAGASWVVDQLRRGVQENVRVRIPGKPGQFKVHNYQRITDKDGNYRGVHEMIFDLQPWMDWYLEQTGQKLVSADDESAAESSSNDTDATSGASEY